MDTYEIDNIILIKSNKDDRSTDNVIYYSPLLGQKVWVKIDNYPEQEFGMLQATVKTISMTPGQEGNWHLQLNFLKKPTYHLSKKTYNCNKK
jgi:hypothetical protein